MAAQCFSAAICILEGSVLLKKLQEGRQRCFVGIALCLRSLAKALQAAWSLEFMSRAQVLLAKHVVSSPKLVSLALARTPGSGQLNPRARLN